MKRMLSRVGFKELLDCAYHESSLFGIFILDCKWRHFKEFVCFFTTEDYLRRRCYLILFWARIKNYSLVNIFGRHNNSDFEIYIFRWR